MVIVRRQRQRRRAQRRHVERFWSRLSANCTASFAYLSLWKKEGSAFVKISEMTRPGILYGFCIASAFVDITTPGDYRVVAAAAYGGQYYPVALSRTVY